MSECPSYVGSVAMAAINVFSCTAAVSSGEFFMQFREKEMGDYGASLG